MYLKQIQEQKNEQNTVIDTIIQAYGSKEKMYSTFVNQFDKKLD